MNHSTDPATNGGSLSAFRLGDVRGVYPEDINELFVYRFGRAFALHFGLSGTVATARDMRGSSVSLQAALNQALVESGIDVLDLGLAPTELGYFASAQLDACATIVVTASHNPARYNGLKCVLRHGEAVTFETGLAEVKARMIAGVPESRAPRGKLKTLNLVPDYISYLAQHFSPDALKSCHVALNGLNGTAATLAGQIADEFELPVTWFRKEPGPIPAEGADPANPRLTEEMHEFMSGGNFGLGIAWDGDCDRSVFFDAGGNLVPTYYVVGLLAEYFLTLHPGAAIVYDTKLCWNTLDIIKKCGGKPIRSKTGHAFMKQKMREHNAIYGGELSSHHFFGDFHHCDSGMFAWLTMTQLVNQSGRDISELISVRRGEVCCTPEISLRLTESVRAFEEVHARFGKSALSVDDFDGPSYEMPGGWRFTLRHSKTEPLVRVNFESRADPDQLLADAASVLGCLRPFVADGSDTESLLHIQ